MENEEKMALGVASMIFGIISLATMCFIVISVFFGIRVTMYYDDHNPPHFHAEYNDQKVLVDILKGRVLRGAFPSRQLKFVLAWTEIHKDELMQNWELAKDDLPLNKIAPLM